MTTATVIIVMASTMTLLTIMFVGGLALINHYEHHYRPRKWDASPLAREMRSHATGNPEA